jgi:hypothetical protein
MSSKKAVTLQPYPREAGGQLLAADSLFPPLTPPMNDELINTAIDEAFARCKKNKKGMTRKTIDTPEKLVALCIKHLRERSDPILSPYFVSQCKAEDIFALDAVSHEMQRHRMTIGVFYQFLILELMKYRWPVFDGSREGDIVAEIDTPDFAEGLRLYMSVKKSQDTVGGQDISGVIRRLESIAKEEKNLTRPYLCVVCVATPARGKIKDYDSDRQIKSNKEGQPYSLNCEYWGPGFIFPFVTGRGAYEIYSHAINHVADHIPFMTLKFRKECSVLLKQELKALGLLNNDDTISAEKFLAFSVGGKSV